MAKLFGSARSVFELDKGWLVSWNNCKEELEASVPGYAQHDMMAAGLLPDPFTGCNSKQWKEACECDYTYTLSFDAPADVLENEFVELVFDGIDTIAEVSLNGKAIGNVDNMYRSWRISVKEIVRAENNELKVAIRNPVQSALNLKERYLDSSPILEYSIDSFGFSPEVRHYVRKMPCSFGWDWGPFLPLSGIWKPVRLEGWGQARIESTFIETRVSADNRHARILGYVRCKGNAGDDAEIAVNLALPDGRKESLTVDLPAGADNVSFKFEIDDPPLWWPNGFGEQPLCAIKADLKIKGESVSQISRKIGIRQLEMIVEPDKFGTSFFVRINGVPLFSKGANWIPADALLSRLTEADYRRLISSAADANMNMLRVWGGGFYEDDIFYDICDELGILVWQDLMFACSVYPVYKEFLQNVAEEVKGHVRRLQHHPCIVLWCGNNEIEELVIAWRKLPEDARGEYYYFFEKFLRGVVTNEDWSRLYWPSSPHTLNSSDPDDERSGDTHYWGVWHRGETFAAYLERYDRFVSEFGYQAFPDLHTVKRFAEEDELEITSATMTHHQRFGDGNERIMKAVIKEYGEPKNFEAFLILSQLYQAQGIRSGVEHWRANRSENRCMGAIYWQLNDNWPVVSWSSIDYFGRWKALHYSAKTFFAPVLVSIAKYSDRVKVCVVNDLAREVAGKLTLSLKSYTGKTISNETLEVSIPPCSSEAVFSKSADDILKEADPAECYFVAEMTGDGFNLRSILHLSVLKDAVLRNPKLEVSVNGSGIEVHSSGFAKCVFLDCDDNAAQFSDNYFDMLPGETRLIEIRPVKAETPVSDAACESVTVRTLYDLVKRGV